MLTSHVDVSGAAHISSREDDEVQDISDDAEATNGRHNDTVTDPPQSRRPRILQHFQVLRQQADIPNLACIEQVRHLAALSFSLTSAPLTARDKFSRPIAHADPSSSPFAQPPCAHLAFRPINN